MFEKMLVPFDGSEHSERALDVSIKMAKEFIGNITLIHVYPIHFYSMETALIGEAEAARRRAALNVLAKAKERVEAEGIHLETQVMEGQIVQEILKVAREDKFDLIVMGARGVSKIRELILGSVSEGVIRHAPCPVLVVK